MPDFGVNWKVFDGDSTADNQGTKAASERPFFMERRECKSIRQALR
jgi:hypothetical protein